MREPGAFMLFFEFDLPYFYDNGKVYCNQIFT